jgi:hypothetical protein
MALEYRLTLASDTPVEVVAARAFPDRDDRPAGVPPILRANHFDKYGFQVTVRGGPNGYLDATADDGDWEWEPGGFVAVGFRLDKDADREWAHTTMAAVIRRILATDPDDAAFTFNGDVLLFTRFSGEVVKHHRESWWSHHPAADQLIPG